jgi:hypothetical protein
MLKYLRIAVTALMAACWAVRLHAGDRRRELCYSASSAGSDHLRRGGR